MSGMYPTLVSAAEMAGILNIDRKAVYALIRTRGIPHLKIGGTYRFNPIEVIDHLTVKPTQPTERHAEVRRKRKPVIDWSEIE